jgi:hypothetical protein
MPKQKVGTFASRASSQPSGGAQTPEGDSFLGGWRKADSEDTWGHVLVHGRGTVGETALHLLFLINSPQHRRLIKLLVPLLSTQVLTMAVLLYLRSYYESHYCAAPY